MPFTVVKVENGEETKASESTTTPDGMPSYGTANNSEKSDSDRAHMKPMFGEPKSTDVDKVKINLA